jgi:DNA-binding transcriptional LysR family regulator
MTRDLPIAYLRTLIAIVEVGSFDAAAQRINRSQSAVTQQMQRLEELTQCKLFVQHGRQRLLNDAGRVLVSFARDIVSLSDSAMDAVKSVNQNAVLRVGVPHEIADHILPQALSQFADHRPDVRVVVQVNRSPELMTDLKERKLDIAVTTRSSDQDKLLTMPTYWIAGKDFEPDLAKPLPLILSDEPSIFRRIALMALDLAGIEYEERFTSSTPPGLQSAVQSGLGITVRTANLFTGETKILGPADGFPELPPVNYFAHAPAEPEAHVNEMLRFVSEASESIHWPKHADNPAYKNAHR